MSWHLPCRSTLRACLHESLAAPDQPCAVRGRQAVPRQSDVAHAVAAGGTLLFAEALHRGTPAWLPAPSTPLHLLTILDSTQLPFLQGVTASTFNFSPPAHDITLNKHTIYKDPLRIAAMGTRRQSNHFTRQTLCLRHNVVQPTAWKAQKV